MENVGAVRSPVYVRLKICVKHNGRMQTESTRVDPAGFLRHPRFDGRRFRRVYFLSTAYFQKPGEGFMRASLCVLLSMSLCALLSAQGPAQPATPAQMTSQPGQQLFPSVAPDKTIAFSQRNGADWDVYVLQHA